jgi:hypothetical protein
MFCWPLKLIDCNVATYFPLFEYCAILLTNTKFCFSVLGNSEINTFCLLEFEGALCIIILNELEYVLILKMTI